MNSTQRLLVIVGIVVVAALGFVLLKGTDDSDRLPLATDTTAAPTPTTTSAGGDAAPGATTPRAPPKPQVARIVVRGLEPVGGVKRLRFRKGDTIRFTVVSDQPEEVHLHGYDVAEDVAPGRPATFAVPAEIEGIFEAELEHSGTQIASITVEP
jgi:hypothetical protein